ncbi:MAG: hypothetical protein IKK51_00040 [Oscillospiraceae bacterium]|nr:hypothetical protein [Oscillospiraceae bacterium]
MTMFDNSEFEAQRLCRGSKGKAGGKIANISRMRFAYFRKYGKYYVCKSCKQRS